MKIYWFSFVIILVSGLIFAVPVKVGIILGGYGTNWDSIAIYSVNKLKELADYASGLDVILFPEFAFAGTDGGGHSRPEVFFIPDSIFGLRVLPADSADTFDILTAHYIDTIRYIAKSETCYIWAATCGEVIGGTNYNSMPIFGPDGKIIRIRRKCLWRVSDSTRDTTIYPDIINVKAGGRIIVMSTICYENFCLDDMLDPPGPPASLWLIPYGSCWANFGSPGNTNSTQRWTYDERPIRFSHFWGIVTDGWIRSDALLISTNIYGKIWAAIRLSNKDRKPFEYQPLIDVDVHDDFVVVTANVPTIDDSLPTFALLTEPIDSQDLIAVPDISSDRVYIVNAMCEYIYIFNDNDEKVDSIKVKNKEAIWVGRRNNANPPGTYYIQCGGVIRKVILMK